MPCLKDMGTSACQKSAKTYIRLKAGITFDHVECSPLIKSIKSLIAIFFLFRKYVFIKAVDILILEIKFLFFKNTVKILKFR